MSGDLDLTYQDIRDAGDHLQSEQERFERELGDLETYINDLVENGYVSGSARAFQESFSDFTKGAKDVLKGLEGMGGFLHAAANAHEETDEELRSQAAGE